MKIQATIAILGVLLSLMTRPVHAAGASDANPAGTSVRQSAEISGRVQNAVTGQYLVNARVSIRGTETVTYTDAFGQYRLVDVPGGAVVLDVFYTELDSQAIAVEVPAGGTVTRDVGLTSASRYGTGEVLKLDPFLVSSNKEVEGEALATNEKRFSPNIKEVMATDALGDILGSNVGEFMKFIPGVTAEYSGMDVTGISIRGIGSNMVSFATDGDATVTANNDSTRSVDIRGMALNNVSRIEVTKVPRPSNPADSLAGSVNMISKSAFERSGAELRYGVSLLGNSENLTLEKTPHSKGDVNNRKVLLGVDFDYTLPIGKNFGFVLTGLQSQRFHEGHASGTAYESAGTATGASFSRPYLRTHTLTDSPRTETRNIYSVKADWRVTPHSVLSFTGQLKEYDITLGINTFSSTVGANGNPNPASGVRLSFNEEQVTGATGRGAVTLSSTGNHAFEKTKIGGINYRFDDGKWRIQSGVSLTASQRDRVDMDNGSFGALSAELSTPVRVTFSNIDREGPKTIQAFGADNQEIDIFDVRNYRITGANAPAFSRKAGMASARLDVRRRLSIFPFPAALQFGGTHRVQTLDLHVGTKFWTPNGPDGNPSTAVNAFPYRAQVYVNQDAGYGFGGKVQWISAARAWSAFQDNPNLFSKTVAQMVDEERRRIIGSEYFEESVSAGYLEAEASLFKSRLRVLGGVRFEKTTDRGQGDRYDPNAVYVLNPDGTFARNAAGVRIRKPEAGAVGSFEEVRLTRQERAYHAKRSYDGYHPSLHLSYDVAENFLVRVAYARTYGRPDYTDVVPSATINAKDLDQDELNDPTIVPGTITVSNTGLRPWKTDNYDVSLEYYTKQGGMFGAGVFLKEIDDFFGNEVRIATLADLEEAGVDPRYVGWDLRTKFNSGDARITGFELNLRHSLRPLGEWGRMFTVFANGTKLRREGHQKASFTSFLPESANWGLSWKWQRFRLTGKWNYRGLNRGNAVAAFGPDGYAYTAAATQLDVDMAYQLTRRVALTSSLQNVLNERRDVPRYGSETPDYARLASTTTYGVIISLGIKGTF